MTISELLDSMPIRFTPGFFAAEMKIYNIPKQRVEDYLRSQGCYHSSGPFWKRGK